MVGVWVELLKESGGAGDGDSVEMDLVFTLFWGSGARPSGRAAGVLPRQASSVRYSRGGFHFPQAPEESRTD